MAKENVSRQYSNTITGTVKGGNQGYLIISDDIINIKYQIANKDSQNMGIFSEPSEASQNAIQLKDPTKYKGLSSNGLEFIFSDQEVGIFRYFPQTPVN